MNLTPDQPLSQSSETPALSSGGKPEEELVMSEVHLGCPPYVSGPHLSRFTFSLPPGKKYMRMLLYKLVDLAT
ncbi:hypothetical protein RHGRI_004690 [Rhododendron griersonianum]|uniref:Uncharacterized protein n=1 Tax=Rhododendron griersonianum TaxID=479676 RepID=A0AAV6LAL1_9ERIC|nr:hypothetical protein RHGRI_004690 [Rhododendron griersonianum]